MRRINILKKIVNSHVGNVVRLFLLYSYSYSYYISIISRIPEDDTHKGVSKYRTKNKKLSSIYPFFHPSRPRYLIKILMFIFIQKCPGVPEPPCEDTMTICKSVKKSCNTPYVYSQCRKTCGKCGKGLSIFLFWNRRM